VNPTDATRPDDPVETPGARTYEQRPVASPVPGHRSPAPTEPGDIGAERAEDGSSREGTGSAVGQGGD
jgi:hypothetical protein